MTGERSGIGPNVNELTETWGFHTTNFQTPIAEELLMKNPVELFALPGNPIQDSTLSSRVCDHEANGAELCRITRT